MAIACAGLRVMRGPDWDAGDCDGGEGHLATLTELLSNQRVRVLWDTGQESTCRVGAEGKFDLRIFDSAQTGVRHPNTKCAECGETNIYGMLWKCKECTDCVLCSQCYNDDKHNLRHSFLRFDTYKSHGLEMKKRKASVRMKAMGMFPGAKVTRGKDWMWDDQDGGVGSVGELLSFQNVAPDSSRNLVKVQWSNGLTNSYRLGFQGQVDLMCLEEEAGTFYYRDHLPVLDAGDLPYPLVLAEAFTDPSPADTPTVSTATSSDTQRPISYISISNVSSTGTITLASVSGASLHSQSTGSASQDQQMSDACAAEGSTSFAERDVARGHSSGNSAEGAQASCGVTTPGNWKATAADREEGLSLGVGDAVALAVDENKLRDLQEDFGGFTETIISYIGQEGEITEVRSNNQVMVRFKSEVYGFNPAALVRVTSVKDGDIVRIRHDVGQVKVLMKKIGWKPDMAATCGKVGRVTSVDSSGEVTVSFGRDQFRYTQACCQPAPGAAVDSVVVDKDDPAAYWTERNTTDSTTTTARADSPGSDTDMGQKLLHMLGIGGGSGSGRESSDPQVRILFQAISDDDVRAVETVVRTNMDFLKAVHKAMTPLMYASYKGRRQIVTSLLEMGADVNGRGEKGRTPLYKAIDGEHEDVALLLLQRGADPHAKTHRQRTPLHAAAIENMVQVVQVLVCMDADVNAKDFVQDTPLFDAINRGNDGVVEVLLQVPALNRYELNARGFNMLQLASLRSNCRIVEMILACEEHPGVDDLLLGEWSALHIAANNDHAESVGYLVLLGGATVNIRDGRRRLTPLHMACKRRQIKAAEALLGMGAEINVFDVNGNSPLHLAMGKRLRDDNDDGGVSTVVEHRVRLACLLITKGAIVDCQNDEGQTPLSCGLHEVQIKVKEFIDQNGHLVKRFNGPAQADKTVGGASEAGGITDSVKCKQDDVQLMHTLLVGVRLQCFRCDSMSDVTLQPCGHMSVCRNCCDAITRCPICDVVIVEREPDNTGGPEEEEEEEENKFD